MNCLFKVRRISTGEIVPVYDVKSDGYIEFLIYSCLKNTLIGKWHYVLADRFEPVDLYDKILEGVEL